MLRLMVVMCEDDERKAGDHHQPLSSSSSSAPLKSSSRGGGDTKPSKKRKTAAAVAAAGDSATSNISAVAVAADEIADAEAEAPTRSSGPSITVSVLQVRVLGCGLWFLAYGLWLVV